MKERYTNTNTEALKPVGYQMLNRYLEGCSIAELALEYGVNHDLIEVAIVDTLRTIRGKVELETSYQLEEE